MNFQDIGKVQRGMFNEEYQLTTRSRVLLEKLTGFSVSQEIHYLL
jgi:hypothetical protein